MGDRSAWQNFVQMAFFTLFVRPFMALFIGLRVRGSENLPPADPFILIANHSSHLDAVSLLWLFPLRRLRRIRAVAAADYFDRNKFVSLLTRTLFNILPIERQKIDAANHPLDRMQAALERGESLIIFPESTRGGGGEVGHFRSGVARLSERVPSVPVVPAWLVNMGRSLPKGEYIPVPFFCEVRLGPPLLLKGDAHERLAALEAAVRQLNAG